METLVFKTNIKCDGCIAKVTPYLNETAGADAWKVDTVSPEKRLTVTTDKQAADIVQAIEKAGYKAEQL